MATIVNLNLIVKYPPDFKKIGEKTTSFKRILPRRFSLINQLFKRSPIRAAVFPLSDYGLKDNIF